MLGENSTHLAVHISEIALKAGVPFLSVISVVEQLILPGLVSDRCRPP
jgi:hypothetical protein